VRKFRFRLKGLEDLKGAELDALRLEFAAAQAELKRLEGGLLTARATLEETYNEIMKLRCSRTDPLILICLESYTGVLRERIRQLRKDLTAQRQETAETRERLVGKHKEKKVLEIYRERKFDEYSKYLERELQKELDEAASHLKHEGLG
jgi:flagellar FliJ protein